MSETRGVVGAPTTRLLIVLLCVAVMLPLGGTAPAAGAAAATQAAASTGAVSAASVDAQRSTAAAAAKRYRYPIRGCASSYGRTHHHYPASDIFAKQGCVFVSPVAGRVHEVSRTDRWSPRTNKGAHRGGRFVSIIGDDGVRYYGGHLASVAPYIKPGVRVKAGQRLGRVGRSGSARATPAHLHFAISWPTRKGVWWVRRGMVAPPRYLDSWRQGGVRSPASAVAKKRAQVGRVPKCSVYC